MPTSLNKWRVCALTTAFAALLALSAQAQPAGGASEVDEPTKGPTEGKPKEGGGGQGAAAGAGGKAGSPLKKPDRWGTSDTLDTVSPWSQSEQKRWGASSETVSPWADGKPPATDRRPAPHEVDARVDLRLGPERLKRHTREPLVRHGIYDRPYLARLGTAESAVAIGGYADVVASYLVREGESDGLSFDARRFNLFLTSRIVDRVRLTSALELEHGTDFALETAQLDVLLHDVVNLRGGVLLAPIGKFNLAHDPPLYDVVDRPLVSTRIIPATLSDVGFGLFGAVYPGGGHRMTYELYAVSGLRDGVIAPEGTRLAAGRSDEALSGDNNRSPAVTGRIAYVSRRSRRLEGELGTSFYAGVYNTHEIDGDSIDDPRWLRIVAMDGELTAGRMLLRGEMAYANVDTPPDYTSLHARGQLGFYVETAITLYEGSMGWFKKSSVAAVLRIDHIDLNLDNRELSRQGIGDETTRMSVGASYRPAPPTSIRVTYHHDWETDGFNNAVRASGVQLGMATYF